MSGGPTPIRAYSPAASLSTSASRFDEGAQRFLQAVNAETTANQEPAGGDVPFQLQVAAEAVRLVNLQTQYEANIAVASRWSEMTSSLLESLN